jgi:hypothetical protein
VEPKPSQVENERIFVLERGRTQNSMLPTISHAFTHSVSIYDPKLPLAQGSSAAPEPPRPNTAAQRNVNQTAIYWTLVNAAAQFRPPRARPRPAFPPSISHQQRTCRPRGHSFALSKAGHLNQTQPPPRPSKAREVITQIGSRDHSVFVNTFALIRLTDQQFLGGW